jgi:ubiquitin
MDFLKTYVSHTFQQNTIEIPYDELDIDSTISEQDIKRILTFAIYIAIDQSKQLIYPIQLTSTHFQQALTLFQQYISIETLIDNNRDRIQSLLKHTTTTPIKSPSPLKKIKLIKLSKKN